MSFVKCIMYIPKYSFGKYMHILNDQLLSINDWYGTQLVKNSKNTI